MTFNANGGTGSMTPQTGSYNTTAPLSLNTFTRTGYSFSGWNTLSGGGGTAYANGASYTFTASVTLYAQWSIISYTVTFNANGGTGSMTPQTGSYNTTAPLSLNTFTRTGYSFSGWNTLSGGGGTAYANGASYTFTASVTLYAQWSINSYTVTYNGNSNTGGSAPIDSLSPYPFGSTVTVLGVGSLVRTGYSFNGWNTVANGSGTSYNPAATFTIGAANVTLYAQWSINSYTVTFNANGGTGSMTPQTGSYNTTAPLTLNTFTRTGYSFTGWNTLSGGGGTAYADGASYTFTASVTLYAQWSINSYTVIFNANGGTGSMTPQTGSYNTTAPLSLNTFTRTGYTFTGWNTLSGGGGTAYADGASYTFTASVTLYAQWTACQQHTVTFNGNGGTGSMSNQAANVPTALTLNTFTRTGYSFSGWNTLSGGGGTAYANGASYSFTRRRHPVCPVDCLPTHTVTFNGNGGTGSSMSNQAANVPTALTLNAFTRTGYTFSGWNTLSGGGGTAYADGAVYSFSADITLYAQWSINSYTVTFNANGGTGSMTPQTGSYNTTAPLSLNTFTRTGYTFTGWNTLSGGGGTAYADGASYTFTASVTLYAQWSINSYTVTFNANGGTGSMTPQTGSYNTTAPLTLNTFTRTGYTFTGWNTLSGGGGTAYADGASYTFTASVTLYAQWTALPKHTVTFNANGGTGSMSNQVANVPTALTLNTFTRTGYSFSGWNTLSGGGGTAYADGAIYSVQRGRHPVCPVDCPAHTHRHLQQQRRDGHHEQPGRQRPDRTDPQHLHP